MPMSFPISDEPIILLTDIEKHYGPSRVLGPLSLSIRPGETLGICGDNGAGKSTLLRIIAGVDKPDAGRVELAHLGRGELGYVPQELALYPSLTGMQNLRYWGEAIGLHGKRLKLRCEYYLKLMNLADRSGLSVSAYSGGMQRRLNLACALLGDTKLLLFDEPTVGADAESVELMLCTMERLNAAGCAIVLISHHHDEIARICERQITLADGLITANT